MVCFALSLIIISRFTHLPSINIQDYKSQVIRGVAEMLHETLLICFILTNRWRPPLQKILTLILQHHPHFHTPNLWRTAVLHLCLYMRGWCMSVQVWVLALSTKMCLHRHTTGTVSSVAEQSNEPHDNLWHLDSFYWCGTLYVLSYKFLVATWCCKTYCHVLYIYCT